jgi:hypothetical protein
MGRATDKGSETSEWRATAEEERSSVDPGPSVRVGNPAPVPDLVRRPLDEILVLRLPRLRLDGGLGLAQVESLLEIAPNALAAREHSFVTHTARRKLHDPDVVVALAMAAGVRGSLIEGPKAVALPLSPHVRRTPTRRRSERKPHGPHFATKMSLLACRPATAPRAPIPTGEHEVPVRCGRLLVGCRPVAEQAPLVRAHLEETAVLSVLRGRRQPGLAPGDCDGLIAVAVEDLADRSPWRQRCVSPSVPRLDCAPELRDRPLELRETTLRVPVRARSVLAMRRGAQKLPVPLEERDRPSISASGRELLREAFVQCGCGTLPPRLGRSGGRLRVLLRCRSGLGDENARAQANE